MDAFVEGLKLRELAATNSSLQKYLAVEAWKRDQVARCSEHSEEAFKYWMGAFYWTQDEKDFQNSVKPFPMDKAYMPEFLGDIYNQELLYLQKSRQMVVTHAIMGYLLWRVLHYEVFSGFVRNQTEEQAKRNIKRSRFGYNHLPKWYRGLFPAQKESESKIVFPVVTYDDILRVRDARAFALKKGRPLPEVPLLRNGEGKIEGVSGAPGAIASATASVIFSDEFSKQLEAEASYLEDMPTVSGGGQYIAVWTPNGKNFAYRISRPLEKGVAVA